MSETLLDEVAGAIAELQKTLEATRAGRRDHVGASARNVAGPFKSHAEVQPAGGETAGVVKSAA